MTSLDVAPATSSPRTTVEVTKRESLWRDGVISIKIPSVCREGAFQDIHFIEFARFVKGGAVHFYVRSDDPTQHCGKTITAEVEVMCKDLADGRSYLYVDLRPTTERPTHRLIVEPRLNLSVPQGQTLFQFQTPAPLEGIVVIAKPKSPEQPKKVSTGDTQLDRLLADGWQIRHEEPSRVHLVKGERTLIHPRPKKKK